MPSDDLSKLVLLYNCISGNLICDTVWCHRLADVQYWLRFEVDNEWFCNVPCFIKWYNMIYNFYHFNIRFLYHTYNVYHNNMIYHAVVPNPRVITFLSATRLTGHILLRWDMSNWFGYYGVCTRHLKCWYISKCAVDYFRKYSETYETLFESVNGRSHFEFIIESCSY